MLKKDKNTVAPAATKIGTVIGPKAVFNGNLSAPETIRIDGIINGDCICEGNLILGTEGVIKGNIVAQNVTLSGKVTGDIRASGKLELFSTARLTGDISAKSLIIDENAAFDGRCTMTTSATGAPSGRPAEQKTPRPDSSNNDNNGRQGSSDRLK